MRALQFVLATSLLLAAGTTSAQTFYITSATKMPLTVTVSPAGAVAVASNAIYTAVESYMGEVRASVGYNFSCSDEISASTFRVQEVLNGYPPVALALSGRVRPGKSRSAGERDATVPAPWAEHRLRPCATIRDQWGAGG
ncbi:MAG: hypothetical protein NT123_19645 [Proteobacteria bacterium]|nr:hypothetical protein [Pseudomonadota bacterium]